MVGVRCLAAYWLLGARLAAVCGISLSAAAFAKSSALSKYRGADPAAKWMTIPGVE